MRRQQREVPGLPGLVVDNRGVMRLRGVRQVDVLDRTGTLVHEQPPWEDREPSVDEPPEIVLAPADGLTYCYEERPSLGDPFRRTRHEIPFYRYVFEYGGRYVAVRAAYAAELNRWVLLAPEEFRP